MTRDSAILKILPIAAMTFAIIAAVSDPATLGLSPVALNWIKLLSTIIGTVSGWASTSWLPGKNDVNTVKPPTNLPVILLAVALGAGALSGVSCAGTTPAQLPSQAATVVQTGDALVKALADRTLGTLDAAGKLLDQVITVEKQVEPILPPSAKATARSGMNALNDAIETAAKGIKAGVHDEAALKALVDPVIAQAQSLLSFVSMLPQPAQSSGGFGALVEGLAKILLGNLGAFHGAPLSEGVR